MPTCANVGPIALRPAPVLIASDKIFDTLDGECQAPAGCTCQLSTSVLTVDDLNCLYRTTIDDDEVTCSYRTDSGRRTDIVQNVNCAVRSDISRGMLTLPV